MKISNEKLKNQSYNKSLKVLLHLTPVYDSPGQHQRHAVERSDTSQSHSPTTSGVFPGVKIPEWRLVCPVNVKSLSPRLRGLPFHKVIHRVPVSTGQQWHESSPQVIFGSVVHIAPVKIKTFLTPGQVLWNDRINHTCIGQILELHCKAYQISSQEFRQNVIVHQLK